MNLWQWIIGRRWGGSGGLIVTPGTVSITMAVANNVDVGKAVVNGAEIAMAVANNVTITITE